jgi:hypothetical protein
MTLQRIRIGPWSDGPIGVERSRLLAPAGATTPEMIEPLSLLRWRKE